MKKARYTKEFELTPFDNRRLAEVSGQFDEKTRGNRFPAGLRSGGVRAENASRPLQFHDFSRIARDIAVACTPPIGRSSPSSPAGAISCRSTCNVFADTG